MPDLRLFGSTSNLVRFTLKDKTTGQGKTGLTGSTSGLIISTIAGNESSATVYTQAATHIQTIATLGTYAAPSASNCRFGEVDSTNHKGLYEFQFADARFAVSSSKRLVISVNDAESTILDADYEIELVQFDPFDTVRLGLTALPNVASGSAGAIPTTGTGSNQIHVDGSGNAFVVGIGIRKNVALANFTFPMISSSDHVGRVTGATVTVTLSIDGAAFGASTNAASEIGTTGNYKINLAAADLNGNVILFKASATSCDDTELTIITQP